MKIVIIGHGPILHSLLDEHRVLARLLSNVIGFLADEYSIKLALGEASPSLHHGLIVRPLPQKSQSDQELLSLLTATMPDLVLSIQYPWKISKSVITSVPMGIANLHNDHRPTYRDYAAISFAIVDGKDLAFHNAAPGG